MSGSNSSSNSTGSSTSTGVATETSTGDESPFSITAETTIQTSTPDDSDGLAAELGGSAVAIGDDSLAAGSIEAQLVDGGSVTAVDGSVTMVAAGEAPAGETADAWTDTFAGVSDGAEVVFSSTVDTQSASQDATGSTATATSTTTLTAYDIDLSDTEDSAPSGGDTGGDEAPSRTISRRRARNRPILTAAGTLTGISPRSNSTHWRKATIPSFPSMLSRSPSRTSFQCPRVSWCSRWTERVPRR